LFAAQWAGMAADRRRVVESSVEAALR